MQTIDDTSEFEALLAPVLEERPWAVFAACKNETSMKFFPQNRKEEHEALAVCAICPVVDDCLDHAIETNERYGVWGGTTERQRRKIIRFA
jgi:WhiB family redox-sensing transcriptional regulator